MYEVHDPPFLLLQKKHPFGELYNQPKLDGVIVKSKEPLGH